MKKELLCAAFTFALVPLFSQQNTVSTGGDASGSNGSVSYSIGQIDYSSTSGTDCNTNEGVQQPFEFFDPDAGIPFESVNVLLYPNPTNDAVILQISTFTQGTQFALSDAKGKIVLKGVIASEETHLDMQNLSTGVYQLQIQNAHEIVSTIKIVKN